MENSEVSKVVAAYAQRMQGMLKKLQLYRIEEVGEGDPLLPEYLEELEELNSHLSKAEYLLQEIGYSTAIAASVNKIAAKLLDKGENELAQEVLALRLSNFHRIPKAAQDLLMRAFHDVRYLLETAKAGDDFHPARADRIIQSLTEVKQLAKEFASEEEVPKEYK
jgi:hypothetical protein